MLIVLLLIIYQEVSVCTVTSQKFKVHGHNVVEVIGSSPAMLKTSSLLWTVIHCSALGKMVTKTTIAYTLSTSAECSNVYAYLHGFSTWSNLALK